MTTFALTSWAAYGVDVAGPVTTRTHQVFTFTATATSADVAWDIGSYTAGSLGTFWTAVIADATYGTLASQALAALQVIGPNVDRQISFTVPEIQQLKALVDASAALATKQYKYTNVLPVPSLTIKSTEGVTAATWTMVLKMLPGVRETRGGTP